MVIRYYRLGQFEESLLVRGGLDISQHILDSKYICSILSIVHFPIVEHPYMCFPSIHRLYLDRTCKIDFGFGWDVKLYLPISIHCIASS